MKEMKEAAGSRATRHLGEMVEREVVRRLADRYAGDGFIPPGALERARADVQWVIDDFERSPTGPSTRNALVLSLVRRTCVDRLRAISRRIDRARNADRSLKMEELEV
jgi:hypothetical protein